MNASPVAAGLVVMGLLFPAAPAAAEILKLDCSVSVDTYNVGEGREGRDSGSSRGVWKVRVEQYADSDLPPEVRFTASTPFGVSYRRGVLEMDYLEGPDWSPAITGDRIEWCPDERGCGVQIPFVGGQGWYSVERAVIDRRRGTLSLSVEQYHGVAGVQMRYTYYGTCEPEPERRF